MKNSSELSAEMSFWEHLDILRNSLIRVAVATVICGVVAFLFKEEVFGVILAPGQNTFVTYRILEQVGQIFTSVGIPEFSVRLINTGLAEQFIIHMKISAYVGILLASPYILYLLFRFISPALYVREKQYVSQIVVGGYIMFLLGVLLCYFLIFPLTFRFLGTYQVSKEVENMITLQSYIGTLTGMTMMLGFVFEIPVVCWLLARQGLISASFNATVQTPCFCSYTNDCCRHYSDFRYFYFTVGSIACMLVIRDKYSHCETLRQGAKKKTVVIVATPLG